MAARHELCSWGWKGRCQSLQALQPDLSSPLGEVSVVDGLKGKQIPVPNGSPCLPWSGTVWVTISDPSGTAVDEVGAVV